MEDLRNGGNLSPWSTIEGRLDGRNSAQGANSLRAAPMHYSVHDDAGLTKRACSMVDRTPPCRVLTPEGRYCTVTPTVTTLLITN